MLRPINVPIGRTTYRLNINFKQTVSLLALARRVRQRSFGTTLGKFKDANKGNIATRRTMKGGGGGPQFPVPFALIVEIISLA